MTQGYEKARPAGGTAGQATGADFGGQDSRTHFNTDDSIRQLGIVSSVLMHGSENAISGRDLVALLGLRGLRELTALVELERRDGVPICASVSGCRGYYLAEDTDELRRYMGSLDRRIANVQQTREAVAATVDRMEEGPIADQ